MKNTKIDKTAKPAKKSTVKKTTKAETPAAEVKKYPVPDWMDDDVKAEAQKFDLLGRMALADKLEEKAKQLRGLQEAPIKMDLVTTYIRPNMKKALLAFHKVYGGKGECDESSQVARSIRWVLEVALPMIDKMANQTDRQLRYTEAEGMEQGHFSEMEIAAGLARWEAARAIDKD